MPGSEISCSGCRTGKKLKTVALEARCKNSLLLECKGDTAFALDCPVQLQHRFFWRPVFCTRAGLFSPLCENMSATV